MDTYHQDLMRINLALWTPFGAIFSFAIPSYFSAKFYITDPFTNYSWKFETSYLLMMQIEAILVGLFSDDIFVLELITLIASILNFFFYYFRKPYINLNTQKLFLTKIHFELFLTLLTMWKEYSAISKNIIILMEFLLLSISFRMSSLIVNMLNKIDFLDTTNISRARIGFMFYCYYSKLPNTKRTPEFDLYYTGVLKNHLHNCENPKCKCKEFRLTDTGRTDAELESQELKRIVLISNYILFESGWKAKAIIEMSAILAMNWFKNLEGLSYIIARLKTKEKHNMSFQLYFLIQIVKGKIDTLYNKETLLKRNSNQFREVSEVLRFHEAFSIKQKADEFYKSMIESSSKIKDLMNYIYNQKIPEIEEIFELIRLQRNKEIKSDRLWKELQASNMPINPLIYTWKIIYELKIKGKLIKAKNVSKMLAREMRQTYNFGINDYLTNIELLTKSHIFSSFIGEMKIHGLIADTSQRAYSLIGLDYRPEFSVDNPLYGLSINSLLPEKFRNLHSRSIKHLYNLHKNLNKSVVFFIERVDGSIIIVNSVYKFSPALLNGLQILTGIRRLPFNGGYYFLMDKDGIILNFSANWSKIISREHTFKNQKLRDLCPQLYKYLFNSQYISYDMNLFLTNSKGNNCKRGIQEESYLGSGFMIGIPDKVFEFKFRSEEDESKIIIIGFHVSYQINTFINSKYYFIKLQYKWTEEGIQPPSIERVGREPLEVQKSSIPLKTLRSNIKTLKELEDSKNAGRERLRKYGDASQEIKSLNKFSGNYDELRQIFIKGSSYSNAEEVLSVMNSQFVNKIDEVEHESSIKDEHSEPSPVPSEGSNDISVKLKKKQECKMENPLKRASIKKANAFHNVLLEKKKREFHLLHKNSEAESSANFRINMIKKRIKERFNQRQLTKINSKHNGSKKSKNFAISTTHNFYKFWESKTLRKSRFCEVWLLAIIGALVPLISIIFRSSRIEKVDYSIIQNIMLFENHLGGLKRNSYSMAEEIMTMSSRTQPAPTSAYNFTEYYNSFQDFFVIMMNRSSKQSEYNFKFYYQNADPNEMAVLFNYEQNPAYNETKSSFENFDTLMLIFNSIWLKHRDLMNTIVRGEQHIDTKSLLFWLEDEPVDSYFKKFENVESFLHNSILEWKNTTMATLKISFWIIGVFSILTICIFIFFIFRLVQKIRSTCSIYSELSLNEENWMMETINEGIQILDQNRCSFENMNYRVSNSLKEPLNIQNLQRDNLPNVFIISISKGKVRRRIESDRRSKLKTPKKNQDKKGKPQPSKVVNRDFSKVKIGSKASYFWLGIYITLVIIMNLVILITFSWIYFSKMSALRLYMDKMELLEAYEEGIQEVTTSIVIAKIATILNDNGIDDAFSDMTYFQDRLNYSLTEARLTFREFADRLSLLEPTGTPLRLLTQDLCTISERLGLSKNLISLFRVNFKWL